KKLAHEPECGGSCGEACKASSAAKQSELPLARLFLIFCSMPHRIEADTAHSASQKLTKPQAWLAWIYHCIAYGRVAQAQLDARPPQCFGGLRGNIGTAPVPERGRIPGNGISCQTGKGQISRG